MSLKPVDYIIHSCIVDHKGRKFRDTLLLFKTFSSIIIITGTATAETVKKKSTIRRNKSSMRWLQCERV